MDVQEDKMLSKRIDEVTLVRLASAVGIDDSKKLSFINAVQDYHVVPKLVVARDTLKLWAVVARDRNTIHLYQEYARKSKFKLEDTPTHATLIAAHVEQYIGGLVGVINSFLNTEKAEEEHETGWVCSGYGLSFKRPLYPDRPLEWVFSDPHKTADGLVLSLCGVNDKGKSIVEPIEKNPNILLRKSPLLTPPHMGKFITEATLIRSSAEIVGDEVNDVYRCMGRLPTADFPFMYAAALVPSVLLEFIKARTGEYQGVYASQNLMFHNPPKTGEFQVLVQLDGKPVSQKRYTEYHLNALVMQQDQPVISGKIVCDTDPGVTLV